MVQLTSVSKQYDRGGMALDNVSLRIEDGEFAFIVGASGSGKSTIIKLITGEIAPTEGEVLVNGFDMNHLKPRQMPYLRRGIGIIFQDFRLIEDKTVYENVAFAMIVTGASKKAMRIMVPQVLKLVGLETKANAYPRELSGGEQQRVAIARALVNKPKLIVADEPTGNLDPTMSLEIMTLLSMINEMGTTMVVVTHERDLVNQFSKRVIALADGKIVGDGKGGYFTDESQQSTVSD